MLGRVSAVLLLYAITACGRIGFGADPGDAPALDEAIDAMTCPAGFTHVGDHCYLFETDRRWLEAEQHCESFAGAHLVVVDDAQEAAAIRSMAIDEVFWIGMSDRILDGDFRTVTAQPPYLDWTPGFPADNGDCVEIEGSTGTLKTLPCTNQNQLLCEADGRAVVPGTF